MQVKFLEKRQTLYGLVEKDQVLDVLDVDGKAYIINCVAILNDNKEGVENGESVSSDL